jgi:cystathionine beta-lyase
MLCDLDQYIDRLSTDSLKWCAYDSDVLPLWVADMDFPAPEPVLRALHERVDHGIFGYAMAPKGLREVFQERLARLYGWQVEKEMLLFMPGVVSAFHVACRAVGRPGDGVLVEPPVYPPMLSAPATSERTCQLVPLVEHDGFYEHDLAALEEAITPHTALFLLCSPHNPVGRVFRRDELEALAEICLRHDVVICSDDIHCDLLFKGHPHVPIASLSPEVAARTITLFAPSKTFNIPGLGCSVAVIPDPELRAAFKRAAEGIVPHVNVLGYVATLAAYRDGQAWLDEVLAYLEGNCDFLLDYLSSHMPTLRCRRPEGTYLAWIDCREAGIPGNPAAFFLEKARVALGDGAHFGPGGEGFIRLNFACPRATLADALERMRRAWAHPIPEI